MLSKKNLGSSYDLFGLFGLSIFWPLCFFSSCRSMQQNPKNLDNSGRGRSVSGANSPQFGRELPTNGRSMASRMDRSQNPEPSLWQSSPEYGSGPRQKAPSGTWPSGRGSKVASADSQGSMQVMKNMWRVSKPMHNVFHKTLRLLSQDYIVTQANKESMTIQTDWDSFFLEGRLLRNRISITFYPIALKSTEVQINNFVEYQKDTLNTSSQGLQSTSGGIIWVPGPDITNETQRVLDFILREDNQGSN